MQEQLCSMFADSSDPIILISDGKIFFENQSAHFTFGLDLVGQNADDVFRFEGRKISECPAGEVWEDAVYIGQLYLTIHCMWFEDVMMLRVALPEAFNKDTESILTQADAGVRSPLSTLLVASNLFKKRVLKNRSSESEKKQLLALMDKNIYRIMRVSEDLSCLSALNNGTFEANFQSMELISLMDEYAEKAATYLDLIGIRLLYSVTKKQYVALIDEFLLERLVFILIALCAKRRKCTEIRFSFDGDDNEYKISIKDNGKCGPEEESIVYASKEQNGLPKPTVSIPLAQAIAKALDGNIVFSYSEKENGILVTVAKKRPKKMILHSPKMKFESGLDPALLQLSDLLPEEFFIK